MDFPAGAVDGQLAPIGDEVWVFRNSVWRRRNIEDFPILESGEIASGTTTKDFELPPEYEHLQLRLTGLATTTDAAYLCARASSDGGATFPGGIQSHQFMMTYTYSGDAANVSRWFLSGSDYTTTAIFLCALNLNSIAQTGIQCIIDIDNTMTGLNRPNLQFRTSMFVNHQTLGPLIGEAQGNGQRQTAGKWTNLRIMVINNTNGVLQFSRGAYSLVGMY